MYEVPDEYEEEKQMKAKEMNREENEKWLKKL